MEKKSSSKSRFRKWQKFKDPDSTTSTDKEDSVSMNCQVWMEEFYTDKISKYSVKNYIAQIYIIIKLLNCMMTSYYIIYTDVIVT